MTAYPQIEALRGRIVVSCQAGAESPLNAPHFIAALARSAELGGAAGFRIDRPENVAAVRTVSSLPIIGINKMHVPGSDVYITPTFASARAVVEAGADIVALDATARPRPGGEDVPEIIARVHQECDVPVMADISTVEEGVAAREAGADLIATTLAGYTPYTAKGDGPALDLLQELTQEVDAPLVVEGRIWTVEDVHSCFALGAYALVIGSAITAPQVITQRFVAAIPPDAARDVVT